jgi:hypothetical protein
MEAEAFSVLRASVSQDRLEPYLAACRGDQAAAARLYARNIQISAAFHAPLGCLQVACRNAMHHQLSALLSREDWWDATELRLHRRNVLPMTRTEISCDDAGPLRPLEWLQSSPSDSGSHRLDREPTTRTACGARGRLLACLPSSGSHGGGDRQPNRAATWSRAHSRAR